MPSKKNEKIQEAPTISTGDTDCTMEDAALDEAIESEENSEILSTPEEPDYEYMNYSEEDQDLFMLGGDLDDSDDEEFEDRFRKEFINNTLPKLNYIFSSDTFYSKIGNVIAKGLQQYENRKYILDIFNYIIIKYEDAQDNPHNLPDAKYFESIWLIRLADTLQFLASQPVNIYGLDSANFLLKLITHYGLYIFGNQYNPFSDPEDANLIPLSKCLHIFFYNLCDNLPISEINCFFNNFLKSCSNYDFHTFVSSLISKYISISYNNKFDSYNKYEKYAKYASLMTVLAEYSLELHNKMCNSNECLFIDLAKFIIESAHNQEIIFEPLKECLLLSLICSSPVNELLLEKVMKIFEWKISDKILRKAQQQLEYTQSVSLAKVLMPFTLFDYDKVESEGNPGNDFDKSEILWDALVELLSESTSTEVQLAILSEKLKKGIPSLEDQIELSIHTAVEMFEKSIFPLIGLYTNRVPTLDQDSIADTKRQCEFNFLKINKFLDSALSYCKNNVLDIHLVNRLYKIILKTYSQLFNLTSRYRSGYIARFNIDIRNKIFHTLELHCKKFSVDQMQEHIKFLKSKDMSDFILNFIVEIYIYSIGGGYRPVRGFTHFTVFRAKVLLLLTRIKHLGFLNHIENSVITKTDTQDPPDWINYFAKSINEFKRIVPNQLSIQEELMAWNAILALAIRQKNINDVVLCFSYGPYCLAVQKYALNIAIEEYNNEANTLNPGEENTCLQIINCLHQNAVGIADMESVAYLMPYVTIPYTSSFPITNLNNDIKNIIYSPYLIPIKHTDIIEHFKHIAHLASFYEFRQLSIEMCRGSLERRINTADRLLKHLQDMCGPISNAEIDFSPYDAKNNYFNNQYFVEIILLCSPINKSFRSDIISITSPRVREHILYSLASALMIREHLKEVVDLIYIVNNINSLIPPNQAIKPSNVILRAYNAAGRLNRQDLLTKLGSYISKYYLYDNIQPKKMAADKTSLPRKNRSLSSQYMDKT